MRPMVFAVATTDGFVFIYDLKENMLLPVVTLHASQSAASTEEDKKRGLSSSKSGEIPLTSLAFNHKQRDLIAACDWLGRVHIWKLSWKLSNRQRDEQQLLDDLGKLASSEENENTV